MKRASRDVAIGHKAAQESQKSEADQFWKDPYGQIGPARTDIR